MQETHSGLGLLQLLLQLLSVQLQHLVGFLERAERLHLPQLLLLLGERLCRGLRQDEREKALKRNITVLLLKRQSECTLLSKALNPSHSTGHWKSLAENHPS